MKLFDVPGSPNCLKVRVLARELGLPLELVPVDLFAARTPAYLAQNPTGKVPTLVDDDGFTLWESQAILVHLASQRPESDLWPADPARRADVMRWLFFFATHLQPWLSVLGQERIMKPRRGEAPDAGLVAHADRELARFLPVLDEELQSHDYLAGLYSIADISVGSGLEHCESRGLSLDAYPHVAAFRDRLRARPTWSDPKP